MIEREIDLETPDGAMNTFVTQPGEGGPHPAVLFYMDAPGKREELHDMARRIATAGFFVVQDTQALLDFVDAEPAAKPGPVGAVGYCMSGPFVFAAAAAYPERFAATASIYGAGLLTDRDDSPHLSADRIRGEIYFACAEIDSYAPKEQIAALAAHLGQTAVNHRSEWYPGVEHGFAFPQREGIYDEPAAERHWERLFDLLERNLK